MLQVFLRHSFFGLFIGLSLGLASCSSVAGGDPVPDDDDNPVSPRSSTSVEQSSSSLAESSSSLSDTTIVEKDSLNALDSLVDFVGIPASELDRASVIFSADSFEISKTEVTQELYQKVMGTLPQMGEVGDNIAVAYVNWYEAVLFCNALSKLVGLDTAYVYEEIGQSSYLKNLTIDYDVKAVRLPTEVEWEIACRAGTSTTYYWNTDVASNYAYYLQSNGPMKVGQYLPNSFGLYDMGGNVAEWTNDWYDAYPANGLNNYRGPESGSYRVVRGGSWSDKASVMASSAREKKDPLYQSQMVGFRISVVR